MLNVVKEQNGKVLIIRLTGAIEETVNFDDLVGNAGGELHVYCRGVPRINSVGVKAWIKYFQSVTQKGATLKFFECSTAIVEQMNLISNFAAGGEVVSILVPYVCQDCGAELVGLFDAQALKQANFQIPNLQCTKCGSSNAVFDDIPEEYFNFLVE